MWDKLSNLKARRQEILENLESSEKYHWSEESQLNLVQQLHDIDEEIDRLYEEDEYGSEDED